MRTRIAFGLVALLAASGCTANTFTGGDGGTDNPPPVGGGAGKDGGSEGGQTDAAVPPGCDATKLPTDDACVINDAEGIFVSASSGSLNGDGTMSKPMSSLDAGIAAAKKAGKRVYVCAETYAEAITLQDGVSVFGYFGCSSGWSVGTSHAKVKAPTSPAARASSITTPTRVEAVDIIGPDFTDKSRSSIALLANAASALTITHATIHAGTGGKGDDGANGVQLTDYGSQKNGTNARSADVCSGAGGHCVVAAAVSNPGGVNACVGEAGHDPGQGGDGGFNGVFQSQFNSNLPGYEWTVSGQGSTIGFPTTGSGPTTAGGTWSAAPVAGANGGAGKDGVSGGPIGVVDANGYTAGDGTAGTSGSPGQGGGGAAGHGMDNSIASASSYQNKYAMGEAGASGGAGGCPGLAGTPGKGGGASIAIIALSSAFTLDTVVVESSAGGAGGAAGSGSLSTPGGTGGVNGAYTLHGANGGNGGLAGVSGNGGGGASIGIAYQGTAPQRLATSVTPATGGAGVAARVGTDGKVIPASPDGLGKDVYSF